jgi:hypothetical protein
MEWCQPIEGGSLRSHVRLLLRSLGNSPPEVATTLRGLRALGRPGVIGDSPVAALLCAVAGSDPEVRRVWVGHHLVVLGRKAGYGCPWVAVRVPPAVRVFVEAFDAGLYPDLVRQDLTHPVDH